MSVFRDVVGVPANPNFFRWTLKGELLTTGGQVKKCLNVFDFKRFSGSAAPDRSAIDGSLWTIIQGHLTAATVARYTVPRRSVRFLDDPTDAEVEYTSTPLTGSQEGDGYASDSAVYMLLKTGARGRSFKGSKHFGGLCEDDTINDQLDASGIALWTDVLNDLKTYGITGVAIGANVWKMVVVSTLLSDLEAYPAVITGADISNVLLNLTIGTMGHRRQKTVR